MSTFVATDGGKIELSTKDTDLLIISFYKPDDIKNLTLLLDFAVPSLMQSSSF